MQGPTHYLFSILITILIFRVLKNQDGKLVFSTIVTINFFFHTILDSLADLTYHPSPSDWSDPIFAIWHLFLYTFEFVVAFYLIKRDLRYVPGMISSVGFDLWDWSIVRPADKFLNYSLPSIHWMADDVHDIFFAWLPNLRMNELAILVEIAIWVVIIIWWIKQRDEYEEDAMPANYKQAALLLIIFGIWRLMGLL